MIKAKFIGKDKSQGFRNGQIYRIRTSVISNYLWVFTTGNFRSEPKSCPYSNLEKLLDNWQLLEGVAEGTLMAEIALDEAGKALSASVNEIVMNLGPRGTIMDAHISVHEHPSVIQELNSRNAARKWTVGGEDDSD